jgi:hypothetical protein
MMRDGAWDEKAHDVVQQNAKGEQQTSNNKEKIRAGVVMQATWAHQEGQLPLWESKGGICVMYVCPCVLEMVVCVLAITQHVNVRSKHASTKRKKGFNRQVVPTGRPGTRPRSAKLCNDFIYLKAATS